MGRPLRILDIGCAQGFFSLHLAQAGAEVLGIDFLDSNIILCNALRKTHSIKTAKFKVAAIEEYISTIAPDQFDVFLGLSVFHHLCHNHGFQKTKTLITQLSEKIPLGVFEFASIDEPLPWSASLSKDELQLISDLPFQRIIDRIPTHLSAIKRPLVVASSTYWLLGDSCGRIETSTSESHHFSKGTHEQTRHYYRGEGLIIKKYLLHGKRANMNRSELMNEAEFLSRPPKDFFPVPKLHDWKVEPNDCWLVREELTGLLLTQFHTDKIKYNAQRVIHDVLVQLASLETAGLFHNDIRIWNTLILEDGGATLLDYGAISSVAKDCASHEHPILSFFAYVNEVITGAMLPPTYGTQLRCPYFNPTKLLHGYAYWGALVIQHPLEKWSYSLFLELFTKWKNYPKARTSTPAASQPLVSYLERSIAYKEARLKDMAEEVAERDRHAKARAEQMIELTTLTKSYEKTADARLEQVQNLTTLVKQHEAESANRGGQVVKLTKTLKAVQTDADARLDQIKELTTLVTQQETTLKAVRADADARLEQVQKLTTLVKQHEAESANRGGQVVKLTTLLSSAQADATARLDQVTQLTTMVNDRDTRLAKLDADVRALNDYIHSEDKQ